MEYANITESSFTLIRTKEETMEIAKEIGSKTDENIALYCHFVEGRKKQRQLIDFEMIEHIEFEISVSYQHSKVLRELEQLMVELQEIEKVKNYLN